MAMLPAAPGLFSTTNCWPNGFDISTEKARAMMDELPPGAKGTTRRIGLLGYVWVCAAVAQHTAAVKTAILSTSLSLVLRGRANRRPGFPENFAQYKRQDAAVLVVVHLDRRV